MKNPDQCQFTKSHEWIADDGTVGISDHAQKEITDVVFVELPPEGKEIKAGEALAVIESVKAAFDIYAPVTGKVKKINSEVTKDPAIVNKSPYGEGWLFVIEKTGDDGNSLMSHADYQKFLETEKH